MTHLKKTAPLALQTQRNFLRVLVPFTTASAICVAGSLVLLALTGQGQWFTSESFRRNELVTSKYPLPNASLQTVKDEWVDLQNLCDQGPVALNFVYTRCTSICSSMGASAAQLAHKLTASLSPAQVLSITFDDRDSLTDLQKFKNRLDPYKSAWQIARLTHPEALQALLKSAGVIVIPDELEEFTHNAAWLVLNKSCKVENVFDLEQTEYVENKLRQML